MICNVSHESLEFVRPAYIRARVLLVAAIVVQLWFLLYPHFGREPYRWSERMRATVAWEQSKTPETKAAMDAEDALVNRHLELRAALYLGGFLLINGLLCYFFWNYGKKRSANRVGGRVSPPASHTTGHAGPRPAVPGSPCGRSSTLSLPR